MHNYTALFSLAILIGIVDQVTDGLLSAEVTYPNGEIAEAYLPADIFPCEIKEGDSFHLIKAGTVTRIYCGKPTN